MTLDQQQQQQQLDADAAQKQRPIVKIGAYVAARNNNSSSSSVWTSSVQLSPCEHSDTDAFATPNSNDDNKTLSKQQHATRITGPNGSVRGHRDVVRRKLDTFASASASAAAAAVGPQIVAQIVTMTATSQITVHNLPQQQHMSNNKTSRQFSAANLVSFAPITTQLVSANMQQLAKQQGQDSIRSELVAQLEAREQGHCVVYVTTLGVLRRTFDDSRRMCAILQLNKIRFDERDIYLSQEYKHELRARCTGLALHMQVPAMFVDGRLYASIAELEAKNESGRLGRELMRFKASKAIDKRQVCACCGDARHIACPSCNGSRKSTVHHFKFNSIALRCIRCDTNNGLVKCPACCFDHDNSQTQVATIDDNNNNCINQIAYKQQVNRL